MQYCEMFSVLVLEYTVCFKLTGPRKQALVRTENTCLFTLIRGRKCWKYRSEPPNLKIFWGRIPPDPPTRLMPSPPELATSRTLGVVFCK